MPARDDWQNQLVKPENDALFKRYVIETLLEIKGIQDTHVEQMGTLIPIKNIVYGLITLILTGFGGALVVLVMNSHKS